MKRWLISTALAAGITALAGPAIAAPPNNTEFDVDFADCATAGIPLVQGHVTGKAKEFQTGSGDTLSISPGLKITLTNPDNGKTVNYVISGTFHTSTAQGITTTKVTGRNLLTRTITEPGIYITVGNFSFTSDANGIVDEFDLNGPGRVIDVCAALS